MTLIHRIKYRFSEPYRIQTGVGLSAIRTKRELKALIKFCEEELKSDSIGLNSQKQEILKETISKYNSPDGCVISYIDSHIEWYWN